MQIICFTKDYPLNHELRIEEVSRDRKKILAVLDSDDVTRLGGLCIFDYVNDVAHYGFAIEFINKKERNKLVDMGFVEVVATVPDLEWQVVDCPVSELITVYSVVSISEPIKCTMERYELNNRCKVFIS